LRKVSSRKSKVDFSGGPEGDHSVVLKNAVKIKYLNKSLIGHLWALTEDRWWHALSNKKLKSKLKIRQNPATELHYLLIAIFHYTGHKFMTLLDRKALQEALIVCNIQ